MLLKLFCLILGIFCLIRPARCSNSQRTAVYAVHFPQFHEDALNNEIWGKGFTEWVHIHEAPAVNRYNQSILKPHHDIGYYDLATYEARKKQAELAKHHGIDGFIYYHYWFYHHTEHKVLAKPLLNMLKDGEPNISFALNWAAATWEKNWMGKTVQPETKQNKYFHSNKKNPNLLYEQICPYENMKAVEEHYQFLRQFFHHPNYIKVNGVPLFILFRYSNVWQCMYVLPKLKELAKKDGFPGEGLYVIGGEGVMLAHELYDGGGDPTKQYSKPPDQIFDALNYFSVVISNELKMSKLPSLCLERPHEIWKRNFHPHYIGIMTQYDNTPRRTIETASITRRKVHHLTQLESFEVDLINSMYYERCCFSPEVRAKSGKFISINAWNEWGEGQVLEPTEQEGYSYLRSVRRIKNKMNHIGCDVRAYKNLMKQYEE